MLRDVETVIVDEIHAVAATKRGAHLALTLERLAAIQEDGHDPQRIGLSATQNPLEEVGRFLVGAAAHGDDRRRRHAQAARPQDPRARSSRWSSPTRRSSADPLDPLAGGEATRRSIWPAIYPELLELVRAHRSTIVFVNNRRGAERLALRLNELAERGDRPRAPRLAGARGAHGGRGACSRPASCRAWSRPRRSSSASTWAPSTSSSRSSRRSRSRAACSASGAPATPSATRSKGRIFPKFRADLLECAVVVQLMREGAIEPTVVPRNALDVLAQQIVAIAASVPTTSGLRRRALRARHAHAHLRRAVARAARERARHARRALPVATSSASCARASSGTASPARSARARARASSPSPTRARSPTAACSASSCPTAAASASSTRRWSTRRARARRSCSAPRRGASRRSARDRVIVVAGARRAGHGAVLEGRHRRAPEGARPRDRRLQPLGRRPDRRERSSATTTSTRSPRATCSPTCASSRTPPASCPSDRTIVVERFRDEIGDWRLCILTPFGGRVHAAWALALSRRIREEYGLESDAIWSDDGIIVHLPDADEPPGAGACVLVDARRARGRRRRRAGSSALFGARFRENAGRALLIPRAYPGKRTPLWQQRLKSQSLLEVAQRYAAVPDHPRDLPRVPARRARPARRCSELLRALHRREITWSRSRRRRASPFASLAALRLRRHVHVRGRHAATPSGAPRRCRSTATCCASCSARRSCAS